MTPAQVARHTVNALYATALVVALVVGVGATGWLAVPVAGALAARVYLRRRSAPGPRTANRRAVVGLTR